MIARFGAASELALRERVAAALSQPGRHDEAIAVFDELIARFGADEDPALKTIVENAKQNRALRTKVQGSRTESQ